MGEEEAGKKQEFLLPRARNNGPITSAIGMEESVGTVRARRQFLFNRTIIWATMVICGAFLIGTIWQAWVNSQQLAQLQSSLQVIEQLKQQQVVLALKEEESRDPAFIEKEAREKLGYVRPGEQVVMIVGTQPKTPEKTAQSTPDTSAPKGFWDAWWRLFFGK